jgi:uncharacterized protein YceK
MSKMREIALFFAVALTCALSGCSRQDAGAIATSAGASYNASYKDNVVRNWQAKVAAGGRCQEFRDRFKAAGDRYNDAANGSFAMDMMKIWESAKAAQCGSTA